MYSSPTKNLYLCGKRFGRDLIKLTLNRRGLTVVELLIALSLLSIVAFSAYLLFGFGWRSFESGTSKAVVQNNLRMASEMISNELRYATAVEILADFDSSEIQSGDTFIYLFINEQGRIEKNENGASSVIPHTLDENLNLQLTFSRSANDIISILIEETGSGLSIDTEVRILNLNGAINNEQSSAIRISKTPVESDAVLAIDNFSAQFPNEAAGHDYGSVMIAVYETADVLTENLSVTLSITGDVQGAFAFNETQNPAQIKNYSEIIIFNIGKINVGGNYTVTVTADADNAAAVILSDTFTVTAEDENEGPEDEPGHPEWQAHVAYQGGSVVSYNGATFEARHWTQGAQPGLISSPWQELTDEWRNFNVYTAGDEAWYNGMKYRAKWYTQNNQPDTSSVWEPLPVN